MFKGAKTHNVTGESDLQPPPYFSTIFAHCVPFPEPGPPRTKITSGCSLSRKSVGLRLPDEVDRLCV